jgi:hypothetical protein
MIFADIAACMEKNQNRILVGCLLVSLVLLVAVTGLGLKFEREYQVVAEAAGLRTILEIIHLILREHPSGVEMPKSAKTIIAGECRMLERRMENTRFWFWVNRTAAAECYDAVQKLAEAHNLLPDDSRLEK